MLLMMTKLFHLREMLAASKDRAWPTTDLETWTADGSGMKRLKDIFEGKIHQGEHPLQPEAEAAFLRSYSRGWTVI
jgi:hypothetical protein